MSFALATHALAQLSVDGIHTHYPLDATPDILPRGVLPALLILPFARREGLFPDSGEGFQQLPFSEGGAVVTYTLTHLLLVHPAESGAGLRATLPALITLIDAYFTALAGDVLLGDTLTQPPQVRVEPGTFTHGGIAYVGCAFRHRWNVPV